MKKTILYLVIFCGSLFINIGSFTAHGQPNPPSDHGDPGNQPTVGGAPIGGGMAMLVLLSGGYAVWRIRKREK